MTSPPLDLSAICRPYTMSEHQFDMLPTIYRLNATNEAPSSQEEILLHQWQSSFLSPLQEVDAAIDRLQLPPAPQLLECRTTIQTLHDLAKPALSPMRRLPGEIFQEIFCFCAQQDGTCNDLFGADRNAGVLKLGHVSRKWRSIAHSYTALWQHALGKLAVENGAKLRDPVALLKFVLKRLGPLRDVSFDLKGSTQHIVETSHIVEALVAVFPRWKSAAFRNLPMDVVPLLSSVSPHPTRLRDLTIIVSSNTPVGVQIVSFSQCFSLEKLELDGIPFNNISLPCDALRSCTDGTLYDASESYLRALEIVQSCPNLLSFTTSPAHWQTLENWRLPPRVAHRSLTSLATSDAALLDVLNLPMLSELTIHHLAVDMMYAPPLDVLGHIERLIQESACDLTTLSLEDCDIYGGEIALEELLLSTPNLRHLSLEFSVETEDGSCMTALVEEMSRKDSVLVPKLESLRYFESTNPEQVRFINAGFVDMLESRYATDGRGLKRVDIEFSALDPEDVLHLSGEDRARLREMKHSGLDISIISALDGYQFI